MMVDFMTTPMKEAFQKQVDTSLQEHGLFENISQSQGLEPLAVSFECNSSSGDKMLRIGSATMKVEENPKFPELVPDTLFYDVPQHLYRMQEILKDLALGEKHLLLIGNQGTGKNKIIDRLLHLLGWEREYIQLHRDTTVQSLTLQPTLIDGVVVWEDSPLVKAVQEGRVLMVDEADKAPLEVVCILKGLIEDGEMLLSDGRKIVAHTYDYEKSACTKQGENLIHMHPNFKMFTLANRPGFPFLGNDFFRECGDVFSVHIVGNPDVQSQAFLLEKYGPDVPKDMLNRLISAFDDLRSQVHLFTFNCVRPNLKLIFFKQPSTG